MKYKFLIIAFLLCIVGSINAQTLTDITTNSDRMESIKANGFNWANPSNTLGKTKVPCACRVPPDCGSGGDDYDWYDYNWAWDSYVNSLGYGYYLEPGTTKAIYLVSANGIAGGSIWGFYPVSTVTPPSNPIIPVIPPPLIILAPQTTSGAIKTPKDSSNRNSPFYITVDDDTTKYYNDSTIYLLTSNKNFKLKIHKDSTILNSSGYTWKKGGSVTLVTGKDSCIYPQSKSSYTTFSVNENSQLINVNVNIIEPPYIVFEKKNNFNWEYGWDEDSKNYDLLKEDFQQEPYGNRYTPRWMSVFANKSVIVNVTVKNLNSDLKKMKDFCVYIKSNNSKIKINNQSSLMLDWNALSSIKTINIYSDALGSSIRNHLRDSIIPQTNANNIIGKLYISCEVPVIKKVVVVYVKSNSSSYPNNINITLENFFNKKSFNQLFRQIAINPKTSLNEFYPTELDLTNVPNINKNSKKIDSIFPILLREYQKLVMLDSFNIPIPTSKIDLKAINSNENSQDNDSISSPNYNNKTRFIFITDFYDVEDSTGKVLGIKGKGSQFGGCYSTIFDIGQTPETLTHELGHILNLLHCFDKHYPNISDPILRNIFSNNFMDYLDQNLPNDQRNQFLYYQWFHKKIVNSYITTGDYWIW